MNLNLKLHVSEHFFSIQGEGSTMGTPSLFIRLGGCNLMCGGKGTEIDKQLHNGAKWRCDTIEVWRKSKAYTMEELYKTLQSHHGLVDLMRKDVHLIFTGGEPLLQQESIVEFIRYLSFKMSIEKQHPILPKIEIETNGTIVPSKALVENVFVFNVSPKLANSGVVAENRIDVEAINFFSALHTTRWKFVINQASDFSEIKSILDVDKQRHKLWLMPSASNREELANVIPVVAQLAIKHKVRFSTRLQVEIWNEVVGV